jgi:hypothetical protein
MTQIFKNKNNILFINNISFIEIINDNLFAYIRKKIKVEKIDLNITQPEMDKFLLNKNLNILRIGKYYINLDKIIQIMEDIHLKENLELQKKDNTIIRFLFDVDYIEIEVAKEYWIKNYKGLIWHILMKIV